MKIQIIPIGTLKNKEIKTLAREYQKKIQPFCKDIRLNEIKESAYKDLFKRKEQESNRILKNISDRTGQLIVLSEEGKPYGSQLFAQLIDENRTHDRDLHFIIGGAYGLSETLKKQADLILSLSPMTFQHDIALLVLFEQIYRAFTIIHNHPYHK